MPEWFNPSGYSDPSLVPSEGPPLDDCTVCGRVESVDAVGDCSGCIEDRTLPKRLYAAAADGDMPGKFKQLLDEAGDFAELTLENRK